MPITSTVTDWGDAFITSLAAAMALFFAAIPKIIGFVLILVIGWFLATLIQKGVAAILRTIHFNNLARRSGLSDFVQKMGLETDASGFVGEIAKWFVRLIALVVAFDALGLPAVSDVLRQLLLWLPNVVVALAVLVIGGLAANALSNLVRGATAEGGFSNSEMLAKISKVAVWAFAIVIAVNQVGVAQTLVNTLFMAVVGAAALAAGLAFGLGGRDTAGELVRNWYGRAKSQAPRIERAVESATDMTAASASPSPNQLHRRRGDQAAGAYGDD